MPNYFPSLFQLITDGCIPGKLDDLVVRIPIGVELYPESPEKWRLVVDPKLGLFEEGNDQTYWECELAQCLEFLAGDEKKRAEIKSNSPFIARDMLFQIFLAWLLEEATLAELYKGISSHPKIVRKALNYPPISILVKIPHLIEDSLPTEFNLMPQKISSQRCHHPTEKLIEVYSTAGLADRTIICCSECKKPLYGWFWTDNDNYDFPKAIYDHEWFYRPDIYVSQALGYLGSRRGKIPKIEVPFEEGPKVLMPDMEKIGSRYLNLETRFITEYSDSQSNWRWQIEIEGRQSCGEGYDDRASAFNAGLLWLISQAANARKFQKTYHTDQMLTTFKGRTAIKLVTPWKEHIHYFG